MNIAAVGHAFPKHYYEQEELVSALKKQWGSRHYNLERLDSLHRNVLVGGRHLALPIEAYDTMNSFQETNDAFIEVAVEIGREAIEDALSRAGLGGRDIDHLFFVSTTGIATPSIDARLVNEMGLRREIKRTPIFGLGCAGGAVGLSRSSDYLKAYPDQCVVLLSVELCSLTLQRKDLSIPNIIATGLFGDGAAAVVLTGGQTSREDVETASGPRVVATRSCFYPDTERIMGWDITGEGFRVVLSADIPRLVREHIRVDVDQFLSDEGLSRSDIGAFICHPGGPKVLESLQQALEVTAEELALTWDLLARLGNLSSASVLLILRRTLEEREMEPGSYGLLLAMGPGFCSELLLLQW